MMNRKNFSLLVAILLSISTIGFARMISVSSQAQLDDTIRKDEFVVVKFGASWCPPCNAMAPEIHRLANKYSQVTFIEIDINQLPAIANAAGIRNIPALRYYKKGSLVGSDVGIERSRLEPRIVSLFGLK